MSLPTPAPPEQKLLPPPDAILPDTPKIDEVGEQAAE
jgi:hypothetical protein